MSGWRSICECGCDCVELVEWTLERGMDITCDDCASGYHIIDPDIDPDEDGDE